MSDNPTDKLDDFLDKADKITKIDLSLDVGKMRAKGDTMTNEEFTEERFDRAYESMRVKSNAESITSTLSSLFYKEHSIEGEIRMTVTADGISFEGLKDWVTQTYILEHPDREGDARAAAIAHLEDDEKLPDFLRAVKRMFWRSTARAFVEEAERE